MRVIKSGLAALTTVFLGVGSTYGQAGNPDYHFVRSEPLQIMHIDLGDVNYNFEGEATIGFTLRDSRAHIWLVIYTKDQPTPEGFGGPKSPIAPNGALWRKAGIPNMVTVVDKGQFEEGSHTITWDGMDFEGNKVESGNYTLYVIGLNDQDDANLVGVAGWNGFTNGFADALVDSEGQGWIISNARELPGASFNLHYVMYKIGEHNWLEDPTGYNLIFVPNGTGSWTTAINPDNIFEMWAASQYDNPDATLIEGAVGNSQQGLSAWIMAEDLSQGIPRAGFGDENSQITVLPTPNTNKYAGITYHNGLLYLTRGRWQTDPPLSEILVLDAQTGELIELIDMNEWWLDTGIDPESGDETTLTVGPNNLFANDTGLYMTSGGFGRSGVTASFGRFMLTDFDANPIWVNGNGDDIGDVIAPEVAEALGMTARVNEASTIEATSAGFVAISEEGIGAEQLHYGAIVGPDGAGLFHIDIAKAPQSPGPWSSGIDIIHEGSDYDGIYYTTFDSTFFHEHAIWNEIAHAPFRIAQAIIGTSVETAVEEMDGAPLPEQYVLSDAYPNPFNPETTIEFALPQEGPALMMVYNIQGQKVKTLVNKVLPAGQYRAVWDGTDTSGRAVSSGVYLYRLRSGSFVETKRMSLLK